jgi:hypothetical protein
MRFAFQRGRSSLGAAIEVFLPRAPIIMGLIESGWSMCVQFGAYATTSLCFFSVLAKSMSVRLLIVR